MKDEIQDIYELIESWPNASEKDVEFMKLLVLLTWSRVADRTRNVNR